MEPDFLAVLSAQNPWWRAPEARPELAAHPLKRPEFGEILRGVLDLRSLRATLLVGPRRVGKSVLLHQVAAALLEDEWPRSQVVLCDLEDPRFRQPPSLGDVVEAHERAFGRVADTPPVFLFDEVHSSERWAIWLKKLVDRRAGRFVATDSAAALLQEGRTESGAGRWTRVPVRFLSFPDFYRLRRFHGNAGEAGTEMDPVVAGPEFGAYLERGGFPENVLVDDLSRTFRDLRHDVAALAIEKDLALLAGRRNVRGLRNLFTALVADSGALFDATARGKDLGVSRQTVDEWLDLLEKTSLLGVLRRSSRSARKLSRAHPKVYATDPGLVCAFSLTTSPLTDGAVLGRVVETAVYRHLEEAAERWEARLSFYRDDGLEADFLLETGEGVLVLEVAAGRAPHPGKARTVSRVASRLKGGVPVCASQVMLESHHDVDGGPVLELPIWKILARIAEADTPQELLEWLQRA